MQYGEVSVHYTTSNDNMKVIGRYAILQSTRVAALSTYGAGSCNWSNLIYIFPTYAVLGGCCLPQSYGAGPDNVDVSWYCEDLSTHGTQR